MTTLRVALGQVRIERDPEANLATINELARRASSQGARLLLLPEGLVGYDPARPEYTAEAAQPESGPFVAGLARASREQGIALAGTVHLLRGGQAENVFVLYDRGERLASYTKLHPYDAFTTRESDTVAPGEQLPPVVSLDGVRLGAMICYDLRFPDLAVSLALAGAEVILCPAAWVKGPLKEHHWTTLVTARALDTTCYLVACGSVGPLTIGRSMVVDPLGVTVAGAGEGAQLLLAELDLDRVAQARRGLPVLANRRLAPPRLP